MHRDKQRHILHQVKMLRKHKCKQALKLETWKTILIAHCSEIIHTNGQHRCGEGRNTREVIQHQNQFIW